LKLAILQNPQQFGLQFGRHLSNFIQEQSAFVRQFDTPDFLVYRPGKRSLFMSEKLTLEQTGRNRRAVKFDKCVIAPSAQGVNRPGDQLLSRPVSPTSNTVESVGATTRAFLRTSRSTGLCPMISSNPSSV